jgi:hypothetical protein
MQQFWLQMLHDWIEQPADGSGSYLLTEEEKHMIDVNNVRYEASDSQDEQIEDFFDVLEDFIPTCFYDHLTATAAAKELNFIGDISGGNTTNSTVRELKAKLTSKFGASSGTKRPPSNMLQAFVKVVRGEKTGGGRHSFLVPSNHSRDCYLEFLALDDRTREEVIKEFSNGNGKRQACMTGSDLQLIEHHLEMRKDNPAANIASASASFQGDKIRATKKEKFEANFEALRQGLLVLDETTGDYVKNTEELGMDGSRVVGSGLPESEERRKFSEFLNQVDDLI